MRRYIVSLHRWFGVALGLYLALLGISGLGMVFQDKFYDIAFGIDKTRFVESGSDWTEPSVILSKAEAAYGPLGALEGVFGPWATPMRISAPSIVHEVTLENGDFGHGVVTFDPYSGEPLASFVAEESLAMLPLKLHLSLFLGEENGRTVSMVLSLLVTLFVATGIYLWWPRSKDYLRALKPSKPKSKQALRRTHAAFGVWAALFIFVSAITGLGLSRVDFAEYVAEVLGRDSFPVTSLSSEQNCTVPTSVDQAWNAALQEFPNHKIAIFVPPFAAGDPFFVALRPTEAEPRTLARGTAELWIDGNCPEIIFKRDIRAGNAGDIFLMRLLDIHNGRILGLFGEVLVSLGGIFLVLIPLTGIWLWFWRRRKST